MHQDDLLFLPEAQLVDKLLSIFNIQNQKQLEPNKLISILGLLNLLNIVSMAQEASNSTNQLNNLLSNSNLPNQNIDSQQINNLIASLTNNKEEKSSNNTTNPLSELLNNQGSSSLNGLLSMLTGNNNKLDPTLILKLMNLVNKLKDNNKDMEKNPPVKSKPYDDNDNNEVDNE